MSRPDDMACDYCGCLDFRFDHRHLICKKCGVVAIRENPAPLEKKPTLREIDEALHSEKLIHYYVRMERFRHVLR